MVHNLQYTLLLLIPFIKAASFFRLSVFTIHFATINTMEIFDLHFYFPTFTIHFATINTEKKL